MTRRVITWSHPISLFLPIFVMITRLKILSNFGVTSLLFSHLFLTREVITHVSREKISFIQLLGEGAFGRVFLGTVESLMPGEASTLVAAKTLKESDIDEIRIDFEREAELLTNLKHPNIVSFYGISMDGEPVMMLFEYMEFGDLNNFLRAHGPHSTTLLTRSTSCPAGHHHYSTHSADSPTGCQNITLDTAGDVSLTLSRSWLRIVSLPEVWRSTGQNWTPQNSRSDRVGSWIFGISKICSSWFSHTKLSGRGRTCR